MGKGLKFANELKLILFSAIIGAVAGIVFWLLLFCVHWGTYLLWDFIPENVLTFSWYPILACTVGGLIIGIVRKIHGDYPEDMMMVFGKLKKNKTYPYKKIFVIFFAALLPLIFGSSVGPEAGMVGVMVALCCWAGDNLKFAGSQSAYYSKVGAAVSLSVMFRSPLFGMLNVEEGIEGDILESEDDSNNDNSNERQPITKLSKVIIYCIATGAGFLCFWFLNQIFGKVSEGFPTFESITLDRADYLLFFLYLLCGIILGLFFEYSEKLFEKIGKILPPIISETIAGVILGIVSMLLPVIQFSGEEQMGILISDFALYAPIAMVGIAFLKVIMTNMCIQLGFKGGHFFPLIFAAVCFGYGLALMIYPGSSEHAIFAAAVVTAATLGTSMKKPLAASMLLLLCFPAKSLLWTVPAAALASFVGKYLVKDKSSTKSDNRDI
ncbi:MAG: chloride channel protein [Lachnospiraceae bacterium]|nr:chloride channel protein [Lachnospiraceae bacterium]